MKKGMSFATIFFLLLLATRLIRFLDAWEKDRLRQPDTLPNTATVMSTRTPKPFIRPTKTPEPRPTETPRATIVLFGGTFEARINDRKTQVSAWRTAGVTFVYETMRPTPDFWATITVQALTPKP